MVVVIWSSHPYLGPCTDRALVTEPVTGSLWERFPMENQSICTWMNSSQSHGCDMRWLRIAYCAITANFFHLCKQHCLIFMADTWSEGGCKYVALVPKAVVHHEFCANQSMYSFLMIESCLKLIYLHNKRVTFQQQICVCCFTSESSVENPTECAFNCA